MTPSERRLLLFVLSILPLMILAFILFIITIPLWIIGKESFEETTPFKWMKYFGIKYEN